MAVMRIMKMGIIINIFLIIKILTKNELRFSYAAKYKKFRDEKYNKKDLML